PRGRGADPRARTSCCNRFATTRPGVPMHVPDGFLDGSTALAAAVASSGGLAVATRRARLQLGDRQLPLAGMTAAYVFAAQMVNFPVAAGTSGHLLGGALAAVLVGP